MPDKDNSQSHRLRGRDFRETFFESFAQKKETKQTAYLKETGANAPVWQCGQATVKTLVLSLRN